MEKKTNQEEDIGAKFFDLEFYRKEEGQIIIKHFIEAKNSLELVQGFATFLDCHPGMYELICAAHYLCESREEVTGASFTEKLLHELDDDCEETLSSAD